MPADLVSKTTRLAFREHLVGTTLAAINTAFSLAGIECSGDAFPNLSGRRRTCVEQYYSTVDFSSDKDVSRLLEAYAHVLSTLSDDSKGHSYSSADSAEKFRTLSACLARDGFTWDNGRITRTLHNTILDQLDSSLKACDLSHVDQQLSRLRDGIEADPTLAIGTAKELVETACIAILDQRSVAHDQAWDLPRLVKETRHVLTLLPEDVPADAPGLEMIKRLLGSLTQVVHCVCELRNEYGTGHGKGPRFKGLKARHTRLAVGAATTLIQFLVDTHTDRDPRSQTDVTPQK